MPRRKNARQVTRSLSTRRVRRITFSCIYIRILTLSRAPATPMRIHIYVYKLNSEEVWGLMERGVLITRLIIVVGLLIGFYAVG